MLLISILLNCLDLALTMACASDYRDPFTLPMFPNEKKRASIAKAELALWYGGRSDQLAVVAAFEGWKSAKEIGQESRFCSKYFVSSGTMHILLGMRKQLASELLGNGFILGDGFSCNLNAQDPGILDDVLVAGLYLMVGSLLPPLKSNKKVVIETAGGDKVRLSPHSTNFKLSFQKFYEQQLIAYDEITRGYGDLSEAHQGEKIMSSPDNTVKVTHPGKVLLEVLASSINAMSCILSYNGMSGISLLHEPVDSLTTMVSATEIGQSDPGWNNIIDMNPNISPNSFEYNGRHQLPNMHHQRGGIHVSKGSSAHRDTMQRGHSKRKHGNGPY
uniref:RNA helicase n=1 Tax=Solanum tuberosum TaxID=4113 RepID=M1AC94_SOLTU